MKDKTKRGLVHLLIGLIAVIFNSILFALVIEKLGFATFVVAFSSFVTYMLSRIVVNTELLIDNEDDINKKTDKRAD